MLLAIDVHYKENYAKVIGVLFNLEDKEPYQIISDTITNVAPYEPGQFYKRELPCLLKLIKHNILSKIDIIIVDGHVYIDNDFKLGLGGYLYNELDQKIPVIGVAKRSFHNTEDVTKKIFRGQSKNPLFVSSIGVDLKTASDIVKNLM